MITRQGPADGKGLHHVALDAHERRQLQPARRLVGAKLGQLDLGASLHRRFQIDKSAEFAVEVDPRLMTAEKANALADIGVNRISVGVQDFDPAVQAAVNRIQSVEETAAAIIHLRSGGRGQVEVLG